MLIKDKAYWQEYNRKRREYLNHKERERRKKAKGMYNQETHVQPQSESVQPNLACTTEANVQPSLSSCSNCEKLQWEVNNCLKRHTIPKEAEFIDLMWDRRYKKFIFYSCTDSCWTGKYCNNCSVLEQQIEKRINQKPYEKTS